MENHSAYRIINKKKLGQQLTPSEIVWFVNGVVSKEVETYQLSALLMAIFLKGFNTEETAALTKAMLESGQVYKFKGREYVDKHSTGGVGDKASFILAPIAAACGVKIPMIAGRGLGHTGGTIDKIESIKGFKTSLSEKKFKSILEKNNLVLMGQTKDIAPADKIFYAIRDVTATVDSIALITASIMSKKLAEGANGIVMDIKTGNGAFMSSLKDAIKLGESISNTAKSFKKKCSVLITDMNQPLGNMVGNSLEIIESMDTLKGQGPKDLTEISIQLAAHMVLLAGKARNLEAAVKKCEKVISNGAAYQKFLDLLDAQGANSKKIDQIKVAPLKYEVSAKSSGYIKTIDTKEVGLKLVDLGGGRKKTNDKLDLSVGFEFHKKIGDKVSKGEKIITIYHNKSQNKLVEKIENQFNNEILKISKSKVKKPILIKKVL